MIGLMPGEDLDVGAGEQVDPGENCPHRVVADDKVLLAEPIPGH
jgi:hypothetical protein